MRVRRLRRAEISAISAIAKTPFSSKREKMTRISVTKFLFLASDHVKSRGSAPREGNAQTKIGHLRDLAEAIWK
jgi:hypothetical protein